MLFLNKMGDLKMTIVFVFVVIYLAKIEPLLKKNANFRTKKLIDIFRYVTLYILMIACFSEYKIGLCLITAFSMVSSTGQLCIYMKIKDKKETDNFRMVLISCTVELFISMALTYYTLYVINPNWFQVNGIPLDSVVEKLFEFIYLTFSILTTHSSGIIVLTGIVPRIFQILHTIIALTVLAKTFTIIFHKDES